MSDKEYIIFCDESDVSGKYYSNFYGGVMVGSSGYDRIAERLNAEKQRLNLFAEAKWSKVTANYVEKHEALMRAFFHEVRAGHLHVRIMFRHNIHVPVGLNQDQIEGAYFRLYYQFIKHAFGLAYPPNTGLAALKLYFDEFPETREAITQFKGFILGLKDNVKIRRAGFTIAPEDITEIRSHEHVIAQCLDIVLGAMAFRLNDKHKEIPPGRKRRGKRTVAKERLYKSILKEIRRIKPHFNIGISTEGLSKTDGRPHIGIGASCRRRWNTGENTSNPKRNMAPLNLHKSLTHDVRLRLKQSQLNYRLKHRGQQVKNCAKLHTQSHGLTQLADLTQVNH